MCASDAFATCGVLQARPLHVLETMAMRVERVIIRGLRALRARDDVFLDPVRVPYPAACLRGLTGSGKTTYLETIAGLWQWLRRCARQRQYAAPARGTILDAQFAGMLVSGLPGPRARAWIAWDPTGTLRELKPGPEVPYVIGAERVDWDPEFLTFWDEAFEKAESGLSREDAAPNMVFIEAEGKYVPALRDDELLNPRPAPAYAVVPRYLADARGPSHLEGLMRTLYLARRERWKLLARWIGELRPGLELLDRFDEATQRPIFRLESGELLFVNRLSAGERSLLINLCMILRWLAPGGVVLLDEPELHLHVSLMRSSLSVLAATIEDEFHGQLIVASHAPEVWDYFRRSGALIELSP